VRKLREVRKLRKLSSLSSKTSITLLLINKRILFLGSKIAKATNEQERNTTKDKIFRDI